MLLVLLLLGMQGRGIKSKRISTLLHWNWLLLLLLLLKWHWRLDLLVWLLWLLERRERRRTKWIVRRTQSVGIRLHATRDQSPGH